MKQKWEWWKTIYLAEIYLRENEYTLAGSIYKGRVTRVLPGMQSAFVDIGLERDAFLYVSDFMELEEGEDMNDVPTGRPANGTSQERPERNGDRGRPRPISRCDAERSGSAKCDERGLGEPSAGQEAGAREGQHSGESHEREDPAYSGDGDGGADAGANGRRDWRHAAGRIRRKPTHGVSRTGSRTEPDRFWAAAGIPANHPAGRIDFQIFTDDGRGFGACAFPLYEPAAQEEKSATLGEKFPDDEPLFARATDEVATAPASQRTEKDEASEVESDDWDREMKRQHERNVAAVFGTVETLREEEPAPTTARAIVEEEIEEEDRSGSLFRGDR